MPKLPPRPRKRNRAEEARERLGISAEEMRGTPAIAHILKAVEGGVPAVIEALRSSDDEDAVTFLEKFDTVTKSDQRALKIEEIAVASGIGSKRLLELAVSSLLDSENQAAALMLATSKRRLIAKSMKMAMKDKGGYDREMMLKATAVLPLPKGASITVPIQVNQQQNVVEQEAPMLRSAEERLEVIQRAFEARRIVPALEPPTSPDMDRSILKRQEVTADVLAPQGA